MIKKDALTHTFLPELGLPRKGKVRDIYDLGERYLMIASDRISVFDKILPNPIPDKGRILTEMAVYWFDMTKDIIKNHVLSHPDPSALVVKKCTPIKLEMVVRGYLVGSLWRGYEKGERVKCGITIPPNLVENDPLPHAIVTPTTKSDQGHDEDISKKEAIQKKICSSDQWEKMEEASLKLFERGQKIAQENGLILLDTKYEFGLDDKGNILLIDEIHTPDSSRYWFVKDKEKKEFKSPDKEFARKWAKDQGFTGEGPVPQIPDEIVQKIRQGYIDLYKAITGKPFKDDEVPSQERLLYNLQKNKLIQGVFVLLLAESENDMPHVNKITAILDEYDIPFGTVFSSNHPNVSELIVRFNDSIEPIVCITTKDTGDPLSLLASAKLKMPVIACPEKESDLDAKTRSAVKMLKEESPKR